MSVADYVRRIKGRGARGDFKEFLTIFVVICIGLAGFGLGRLSKINETRPPVAIMEIFPQSGFADVERGEGRPIIEEKGEFVASQNGARYHYPWCPGAQQIKEENKVWFATREDAEQAGYTPAANCEGL